MSTDDLPQQPGSRPGTGTPPPEPAPTPSPEPGGTPPPRRGGDGFFDSIRRMGVVRSDDRWVGGVAGGVAARFGLDPLLVRGLLVLSFFLTGASIVVYAIAWALLPEQRDGRIHVQQAVRGDFDVALLGAVITMVVGFAWNDGFWSWGFHLFDWVGVLLWIAVWVAIVWLVVKLIRDRGPRPPAAPGAWDTPPPPASGGYAPSSTHATGTTTESGPAPFAPAPPAPYLADATPAAPSWAGQGTTAPADADRWSESSTERQARRNAERQQARSARQAERVARAQDRARRGPGLGTVGVVVGLALLAGALLLVADRTGDLGLPLWATWLGAALVILGLGIVVSGLRGRHGGGLTGLAVLALVAGLITWPFADGRDVWDVWDDQPDTPNAAVISEGTLAPQSVDDAENGYQVRFGNAAIDLTELELSGVTPGDPVVVPISTTAGNAVVRVPDDEAVTAEIEVIAGNATWSADGENRSVNTYTNGPARFSSDEVSEVGGPRLLLDVDVRAGDLTIEESR